jgi:outer membrane protein TolC
MLNNQSVLFLFGRWTAFMYFYVFLCISTYSQSFSQSDSLYQYLTIAAKNNPYVLQKFYEYKAALQKVPQVGALQDPDFTIGVFVQPMELVAGNEVADLKLMQMFPWFGTLKAAKDEMSLMAKAKFESFREAKLQVFFDVRQSWFELQKIQNEIRFTEKNLDILKTIERLTLVKYKASPTGGGGGSSKGTYQSTAPSQNFSGSSSGMKGMVGAAGSQPGSATNQSTQAGMSSGPMGSLSGGTSLADLYRIRIEMGDLENNIALLKNQITTVTARFNSYLNRIPLTPVTLPDSLTPDSLGISLSMVTDSVIAHNPMLGMLLYERQSIDVRKKMVTRMGYPMIGLGVDYSVISKSDMSTSSMNGKDMIMPMATLTLPIYRNKYNAMKKETDFLKSANEQNYQATVNSLQTEYYEASQLYKDGARRIILYDNQSSLAEKTLDIMLSGFATAETPLTDILRVRQQTLDYEFKKIEAIADYNLAISWLQRLMATQTIKEN